MEDDLKGTRPQWKTGLMEDDLNKDIQTTSVEGITNYPQLEVSLELLAPACFIDIFPQDTLIPKGSNKIKLNPRHTIKAYFQIFYRVLTSGIGHKQIYIIFTQLESLHFMFYVLCFVLTPTARLCQEYPSIFSCFRLFNQCLLTAPAELH